MKAGWTVWVIHYQRRGMKPDKVEGSLLILPGDNRLDIPPLTHLFLRFIIYTWKLYLSESDLFSFNMQVCKENQCSVLGLFVWHLFSCYTNSWSSNLRAEFLDEIHTKVLIVFLLDIHSHLYTDLPWDFYFFKLTRPLTVSKDSYCKF